MRIVLVHEAELEFWASVDYYENQEPGLGVRFEHEVDQFLGKILADPMRPRLRRKCYRQSQSLDFSSLHRIRNPGGRLFGLSPSVMLTEGRNTGWKESLNVLEFW